MKSASRYIRTLGRSAGYGVVGFTAFLLVLLWGAVAYQLDHEKTAILDDELTDTRNLARAYAEHVTGTLRLLDQMLLRIKSDYEKNSFSPDVAQNLHVASNIDAGAVLVALVDEHGNLTASTLPLPPAAAIARDREYFRAQARGDSDQLYISEPMVGRITGRHTIVVLSRGLKKPDGTFAGIVYVSFDPHYLSGFFRDLVISKDSSFAVVGRDMIVRDMIRGSGRATEAIGKSMANSQLVPALAGAPNGEYEAADAFDGFARIYAYRTLPDYPLIVLASFAEADVLADFEAREISVFGVAAALSLIFIGVAAFQLRRLAERKESEIALNRSRENLARAQQIAGIGSFSRDIATGRMEWSDEFLKIWGISAEPSQLTIEFLTNLVHPEDRRRFREGREAALQSRPAPSQNFRITRPDGEVRILQDEISVSRDENGKPVRIYGTIQDVTERHRMELELRRSREDLARAQQISSIGSFGRDVTTGRIDWSDEFLRIWGLSDTAEKITAERLALLVHPEDRQKFLEGRDAVLHPGSRMPLDFRITRPDGEERILHREYGVIFDDDKKPLRVFGAVQDITERKKIEIELHRSREHLARAQRIAAIGSFDRDFVTDRAEWSDEMYFILGLEKADVLPGSDTLIKLVHPDDRGKFMEERAGQLSGQPAKPIEYRIIRPDGAERIVRREIVVLFDEDKRPVRHYGTLQDITELRLAERRERELERQLLHSQKLEALGTLAGGIAHDLNNTLTPIMALSKIAARGLEPGSALRANLETIFAASEQARDLVKRVLGFSRRDKIDKRPINLREVVNDALKLLRATIPTSIQLDTQIGEVPLILADALQFHQVITNLVSNAAQAIGGSLGVITVRLDVVFGSAARGTIRLSVIDTGEGMDEATRRRIFEPFFTTKQVGKGTGLGLSIIEGIVADHGGRIEVESEPGQGTRFDLYFPLPDAEASAAA